MTLTHYSSGPTDAPSVREVLQERRLAVSALAVLPIDQTNQTPLYFECRARLFRRDGVVLNGESFLPQLQAAGVATPLTGRVLDLALDWLDADPCQVLGCSISAQDLDDPDHWFELYARIARRPRLAKRLILEITEARPIIRIEDARDALNALRAVGVRIAFDDFGKGFATPDVLSRLEVDIVKVCAHYIDSPALLRHLVNQARSSSATAIVVKGVQTSSQVENAARFGATHFQKVADLSRPRFRAKAMTGSEGVQGA